MGLPRSAQPRELLGQITHRGAEKLMRLNIPELLEENKMKVLAINNGRDHAAYTFIEGEKGSRYVAYSAFLKGNIMEEIKELCRHYQPDEIVLQLPPTGLDERTRKAIQEGFGRNVAAAFSLGRYPIMKDLLRARAAHGCYSREEAREFFCRGIVEDGLPGLTRRQQMQLHNTTTLAYDTVKAAEGVAS